VEGGISEAATEKSTREVAVEITKQVAVGCWQFQSPGHLTEMIDKALRDRDERAARIAETPYSDEVQAFAGDEPKAVGEKIASAIRGKAMINEAQPAPVTNDSTPIWELVIADMHERDHVGRERYGTPLQANNGRDALQDAYEEALDLVVYLRQAIKERECKS
jgi:hypothetical protein